MKVYSRKQTTLSSHFQMGRFETENKLQEYQKNYKNNIQKLLYWLPKNIPTTPSQLSKNPSTHIIYYAILVGKLKKLTDIASTKTRAFNKVLLPRLLQDTLSIKGDSHPLPFSVLEPHSLSRICTRPQYRWSHLQKPKDRSA